MRRDSAAAIGDRGRGSSAGCAAGPNAAEEGGTRPLPARRPGAQGSGSAAGSRGAAANRIGKAPIIPARTAAVSPSLQYH